MPPTGVPPVVVPPVVVPPVVVPPVVVPPVVVPPVVVPPVVVFWTVTVMRSVLVAPVELVAIAFSVCAPFANLVVSSWHCMPSLITVSVPNGVVAESM